MDAPFTELVSLPSLANSHDLLVGIGPLVAGLVVVAGLILAVAYGIRLRKRGDQRQSGPAGARPEVPKEYETTHRVPDEVPRDGRRRRPHEFKDYDSDSHPGEHEWTPPKWDEGSSGGFGSGGPGHT